MTKYVDADALMEQFVNRKYYMWSIQRNGRMVTF